MVVFLAPSPAEKTIQGEEVRERAGGQEIQFPWEGEKLGQNSGNVGGGQGEGKEEERGQVSTQGRNRGGQNGQAEAGGSWAD